MSNYAIQVEDISKSYRIRKGNRSGYTALRDVVTERVGNFFQQLSFRNNPFRGQDNFEEFWALKEVSFNVKHGEVLGVIGRNGAGKSTLLKILSRITEPTQGKITLNGRVGSLLEVGTGFHPELTGRENIFLCGAILGMTKPEIKQRFDEIVDFAGVEQFLDTPVKRYSSGMHVRLGFAVAAHLETEILLIDEVLAVGDLAFHQKCSTKIQGIVNAGKTVLLVSHNLGLIQSMSQSCLVLESGMLLYNGNCRDGLKSYSKLVLNHTPTTIRFNGPLREIVKLCDISINGNDPLTSNIIIGLFDEIEISVKLSIKYAKSLRFALAIFCDGVRLFSSHDSPLELNNSKIIEYKISIPKLILRPAVYSLSIGGIESNKYGDWFWRRDLCNFSISPDWDDRIELINEGYFNVNVKIKRNIDNDS